MLRSVRNPDKIIRRIFGACSSQLSLLSIVASRPASVVVITTIIEFVDFNTSQAEEKAKHHRHSRSMPCTQLHTISFANKPYSESLVDERSAHQANAFDRCVLRPCSIACEILY